MTKLWKPPIRPDELYHYGVKGMKWHKRKKQQKSGDEYEGPEIVAPGTGPINTWSIENPLARKKGWTYHRNTLPYRHNGLGTTVENGTYMYRRGNMYARHRVQRQRPISGSDSAINYVDNSLSGTTIVRRSRKRNEKYPERSAKVEGRNAAGIRKAYAVRNAKRAIDSAKKAIKVKKPSKRTGRQAR